MADSRIKKKKNKNIKGKQQLAPGRFHISGTLILGVAVAVFLLVMGSQIYQLKQKKAAYDAREEELQEQYEEETERAEEIESLSEYMKTTQYIEDTAKSKLGLAYEDEIIFKEKD